MNIILLSGGSGKRLWPLSNSVRSKQFIKIFKASGGNYESMLQRVYRQIKEVDPVANVTIATSKNQVSTIHNQLGVEVGISVEPYRKDTFPAILLAAAYLTDIQEINSEEAVIICPVDPYVENYYFEVLKNMSKEVESGTANLVLMGLEPTYPSEKYGYIIPDEQSILSNVITFKEKPDTETAKSYLAKGALWNGGVFACKLKYILEKGHELLNFKNHQDLMERYNSLEAISFDYAIVEKESNIKVMRYMGQWKDLGTWNTFTEAMEESVIGNGQINGSCSDVHIINELDMPVLAMGMNHTIISASPEGILVSDKEESSYIKPFVDTMDQQIMFAEKSWGSFRVVDVSEKAMTIKVTLNQGHRMNYHSHQYRDEVWVIIKGQGKTIVDGMEQEVHAGDVVTMQAGCRHTIIADQELQLIEIQIGDDISIQDKRKYVLEQ